MQIVQWCLSKSAEMRISAKQRTKPECVIPLVLILRAVAPPRLAQRMDDVGGRLRFDEFEDVAGDGVGGSKAASLHLDHGESA